MVGRRGIEPRNTCVSGRPRRPAGSRPAECGGAEPRARRGTPRVFKARCRAGGTHSMEESGGPAPHRPSGHPLSGRGLRPWQVHSPRGRRRIRISRPRDPHPLSRRGPPPGDFISHSRKAGDLNAAGLTAHRLAGEPGTPVRCAFRSAPRIRTEIHRVWTCWLCQLA